MSYQSYLAKILSGFRGVATFLAVTLVAGSSSAQVSATYSTVYSFTGAADGNSPLASLIQGADGNLYGAAPGGSYDYGTLFKITPSGSFSSLYTFTGAADGAYPSGSLIQGGDGNFYGATNGGGSGYGTIYKISPGGKFTLLYTFTGDTDGGEPLAGLIQGSDGNFYGMTWMKTTSGLGTIYKITPSGSFTLLYTFTGGDDGGRPFSTLVQGSDGNFYGTAADNGANGDGTLFKITPSGAFTLLYTFTGIADGSIPETALVQASDGNFYGAASDNSTTVSGTFFKVSPAGDFNVVSTFLDAKQQGVPNTLFLAGDGNFYGTSEIGGSSESGNAFVITPAGLFESLYNFTPMNQAGYIANSALLQASDSNFYGTTTRGGSSGHGTVYKLTLPYTVTAPVQLSLSSSSITVGTPVTLSFNVGNAFSATMQQCYGFQTVNATTKALGKVTGTYNSTTLLYSGAVTLTPAAGTYTYALTCGGQESGYASLTVLKNATATSLSAAPDPATIGQRVTLSATVTKSSGSTAPTGTVDFYYASRYLGAGTLNSSGVATYSPSTNGLPPGKYGVTASYSGDSTYSASQSTATVVTLNPAPTATTLSAAPTSVTPPAKVTLTAVVNRTAEGAVGTPTGSVTFYYGSLSLGSATLNSAGTATLVPSTSGVPRGNYGLTAKYKGDSADTASTSNTVVVAVQ